MTARVSWYLQTNRSLARWAGTCRPFAHWFHVVLDIVWYPQLTCCVYRSMFVLQLSDLTCFFHNLTPSLRLPLVFWYKWRNKTELTRLSEAYYGNSCWNDDDDVVGDRCVCSCVKTRRLTDTRCYMMKCGMFVTLCQRRALKTTRWLTVFAHSTDHVIASSLA